MKDWLYAHSLQQVPELQEGKYKDYKEIQTHGQALRR